MGRAFINCLLKFILICAAVAALCGLYKFHLFLDDYGYYEYVAIYKWIDPKPKYDINSLNEEQRKIALEFESVALMASATCHQEMNDEFDEYTTSSSGRFSELSKRIKDRVKDDLDGILARLGKSEDEKRQILNEIITSEYKQFVDDEVKDLLVIREQIILKLKSSLLVDVSFDLKKSVHIGGNQSRVDTSEIVKNLQSRSQLIGRGAEEALTFVPIGGDLYDLYRSFVHDYRFEKFVGRDIDSFVETVRLDYETNVYPTIKTKLIPDTRKIWYDCVTNFNPASATDQLNSY